MTIPLTRVFVLSITVTCFVTPAVLGQDIVSCDKIGSIIREYGSNGILTLDQATRYFLEKSPPKFSLSKLQQEAKKKPITLEKLDELKTAAAAEAADDLINQYGNGQVVTEKDLENYFVQTDATFKKECAPDLFTRLFKDRLHVRNSTTSVTQAALPAQFSWIHSEDSGTGFQVDAAISYDFPQYALTTDDHWNLYVKPAFEAHTSNLSTATTDSLSAKLPAEIVWGAGETEYTKSITLVKSVLFSLAPYYETDRKTDITNYGSAILVAPSVPKFGIGAPWHWGFIYPSWQPYVGLESGYVGTAESPLRSDTDFERFVLKLHGQVFVTQYFELAIDYTHRTFLSSGPFLSSDQTNFDYYELAALFWIDPIDQHFSIGVGYKNGESTPKFSDVESVTAFLGIKF
jgi:hypothetical protein